VSNQREPVELTRAEVIGLVVALHQSRLRLEAADEFVDASTLALWADFLEDRLFGRGDRPNT